MENAFALLLKTPAEDNTGKQYILEKLTQCGSKNYPIKDPFIQMRERSLNTYISAWTGSDYTMYPFTTSNS